MKNLKGSKTEQNLVNAVLFEARDYQLFSLYEEQAKREGLEEISKKFNELASEQKAHANLLTHHLKDEDYEVNFTLHFHKLGRTDENLKAAVELEIHEYQDIYPRYAKEAREEGYDHIEEIFQMLVQVENCHHMELDKYYQMMINNKLFSKSKDTKWKCINCGRELNSKEAPERCPLCNHKQGFFKEDPDQNTKNKKQAN